MIVDCLLAGVLELLLIIDEHTIRCMINCWEFGRPVEDLELLLAICVFGNLEKPKVVSWICWVIEVVILTKPRVKLNWSLGLACWILSVYKFSCVDEWLETEFGCRLLNRSGSWGCWMLF